MKNNLRYLCIFAVVLSTTPVFATVWSLEAALDGLQETPPNASPGFGVASLSLDDVSGVVTVTSGSFSGLLSPATAMHIHGPAAPGVAAGVLIPLSVTLGTSGTFSGGGPLPPPLVADMLGGFTYLNIHTSAFPGGEIRGQISVVPEPSIIALAGMGTGALLWQLRRKHS